MIATEAAVGAARCRAATPEILIRSKRTRNLTIATCSFAVALLLSAAVYGAVATPADVVRNFYAWYIHELGTGIKPLDTERPEIRKFVSDQLLLRIDEARKSSPNRDPFLNAQEIDPDWGSNIAVGNIFVGRIARLSLTLTGRRVGDRQMELKVVRENSAWKIDQISFE